MHSAAFADLILNAQPLVLSRVNSFNGNTGSLDLVVPFLDGVTCVPTNDLFDVVLFEGVGKALSCQYRVYK